MPIQIKQTTPDEAITRLRQIHSEVQDKFHDQWDWMDAEYCVEVLQSTIDIQRAIISCGLFIVFVVTWYVGIGLLCLGWWR